MRQIRKLEGFGESHLWERAKFDSKGIEVSGRREQELLGEGTEVSGRRSRGSQDADVPRRLFLSDLPRIGGILSGSFNDRNTRH